MLTCQPSYRRAVVRRAPRREQIEGFDVVRWPVLDDRTLIFLKVVNLLWFCLRLDRCEHRTFRGADVVMAATTPPVFLALVCSLLARLGGAQLRLP